ncbi:putative toxin-antitoxin system toxin component, PIN family [Novosphingobium sp.]|uniref:putative toxin-antitoxin system toxin component, PIN family n=1 Tax=Novosphingobium sp. TaxID=1874826 RepID=UPI0034155DCE
MRLVLDTNVVLSALLWGGKPAELINLCATQAIRLYSSERLLDELAQSLRKPKLINRVGQTGLAPDQHVANYRSVVQMVEHGDLARPASRDADDDFVLACAQAARANVVVTGDDDLLVLSAWDGIAILTVAESLSLLKVLRKG